MCKEEKIESKFLMSARKIYNFILVVDSSNSQAKIGLKDVVKNLKIRIYFS